MMARDEFVATHRSAWTELDGLLSRSGPLVGPDLSRLSALYRGVSSDVMTARAAGYGADLTGLLDGLAARAHAALYGHGRQGWRVGWQLVMRDFPRGLRDSTPFTATAAILFVLPLAAGLVSALLAPGFAERVLSPEQLQAMAEMYARGVSGGRELGSDAAMAGFYVMNNVGIAFRCFATGVLFGAGSVFFLVYNGLVSGTVIGHVIAVGHGRHILTFVCGHAPYELGAIIVAGGAGLRLGYSLLATGNLTRLASLRLHALGTVPVICGAAAMLLVAAAIESFWSPSRAPYPVKWAFGATSLVVVALFCALAGRVKTGVVGTATVSRGNGGDR
ncbi:MAG: stage II sporulation protein M [Polyangiaceae bacterium]|nr:stage II sporulation protein M [Polyangiaceae bacterium]